MEDKIIQDRLDKLKKIEELGIDPYPHGYDVTHLTTAVLQEFDSASSVESEKRVSIAGRIMLSRSMGKIAFIHIQDRAGKIQVFLSVQDTNQYELVKLLDMGDIIGVEGPVFRTKTGEITIKAKELKILSKSLRPLPEKYHGLQDVETKYRKRYLDLIANKESRDVFLARTKIITTIRSFLDGQGYVEVDTPILQTIHGGANAKPFITHHNALDLELALRISDELYLKRLIIGGLGRVYEICRNFRNEGIDTTHNPEFTMIEWYEAYADYNVMMKQCEQLIAQVCMQVHQKQEIRMNDNVISLKPPFRRLKMVDAIKEYADIDVLQMDEAQILAECEKRRIHVQQQSWGAAVQELFDELVEDKLIQPTFIIDYPWETSPLTKLHREDKRFVERFELFINGWEIANAYSELSDPRDQKMRFEEQAKNKEQGDEEAQPTDMDFVEAMEYGMPPTGGIGIGIDRLTMIIAMKESIRDVVLFPTLRPDE